MTSGVPQQIEPPHVCDTAVRVHRNLLERLVGARSVRACGACGRRHRRFLWSPGREDAIRYGGRRQRPIAWELLAGLIALVLLLTVLLRAWWAR